MRRTLETYEEGLRQIEDEVTNAKASAWFGCEEHLNRRRPPGGVHCRMSLWQTW
jgi:hypothetical protein